LSIVRPSACSCQRYSGRVGRSAGAKDLDERAVRLAVVAHVRHHSEYDGLLADGWERADARRRMAEEVDEILEIWELPDE
jgi:hypothetical protein